MSTPKICDLISPVTGHDVSCRLTHAGGQKLEAGRFGQWLREQRENAGLSQDELAGAAGIKKAFISKLENATKHTATGASPAPSLETLHAIVKKLNVPITAALERMGLGGETVEPAELELRKLTTYFKELPRECQLDVLSLTEALWRRRRTEGRAERASRKSGGKHRPETVRPGVPRKGAKRKAG